MRVFLKHLWMVVSALLVANPCSAQSTPSRGKALVAPKVSTEEIAFNDGAYAVVNHKSPLNKQKHKDVTAVCPEGMKAMSAGFGAASGRGEPRDYRIILSAPTTNGAGWAVSAVFDGSGDSLAADIAWELRIYLVCAKLR